MGYYIFYEDDLHRRIEGRYWNPSSDNEHNPQSLNICVVASITKKPNGEGFDWTAYIGAAPGVHTEEEALKATARTGAKLGKQDARYFFPDIKLPYRS